MSDGLIQLSRGGLVVPSPAVPVRTRPATVDDIPFMDGLQKNTTRQVGYFPTGQFKGYIEQGAVVIAEESFVTGHSSLASGAVARAAVAGDHGPMTKDSRLGYVIAKDRYLKRDELGVIYQLNVVPGGRRKLVGASLIKSVFERSAYGCKMYCCWCAQDIQANYFWESLGFVPIAFRAGSTGKKRVHIFWQRRINAADTGTAWWYPFQTTGGAMNQDRLVFPIPPGVRWQDVRGNADFGLRNVELEEGEARAAVALPAPQARKRSRVRSESRNPKSAVPPGKVAIFMRGKIRYVDRPGCARPAAAVAPVPVTTPRAKREKPPAAKFDPAYLAAARELRDRWVEEVNAGRLLPAGNGKYEVGRAMGAAIGESGGAIEANVSPTRLLAA